MPILLLMSLLGSVDAFQYDTNDTCGAAGIGPAPLLDGGTAWIAEALLRLRIIVEGKVQDVQGFVHRQAMN